MEYFEEIQDRVILIGVQADRGDDMEESLDELGELAATAGAAVAGRIIQNREAVHPGTYLHVLWDYVLLFRDLEEESEPEALVRKSWRQTVV